MAKSHVIPDKFNSACCAAAPHVPPALADALDEEEVYIWSDLFDADEHVSYPDRSQEATTNRKSSSKSVLHDLRFLKSLVTLWAVAVEGRVSKAVKAPEPLDTIEVPWKQSKQVSLRQ